MAEEEKKHEGRPISRLQISSENSFDFDGKKPESENKSELFQEPSVSLSIMDAEWVARNVEDQSDQREDKKKSVEKNSGDASLDLDAMLFLH